MDTTLVAQRARRLHGRALALSSVALMLCRSAAETRAQIAAQVRLSPFRRSARLARGGSREPITETPRRQCPFCNGDAVKEAAPQSMVNGTIKSLYRCRVCDVPFLWVRSLVQTPRP